MKFTFDEVCDVVSEECNYFDGEPLIWFEMVWMFMDKYGLNIYNNVPEKLSIYCRIYGMCLIYSKFCDILNGGYGDVDHLDLDIDVASLYSDYTYDEDETLEEYLMNLIEDGNNVKSVFDVLNEDLNLSTAFASLYYSRYYSRYSLQDWETDEYYYADDPNSYDEDYETRKAYAQCKDVNEIYNDILNEVDADRMEAFSWLSNYMS